MLRDYLGILVLTGSLMHSPPAQADPTIISPLPANGASPSASLVFSFSEPMNTNFTGVVFYQFITQWPMTAVWSGGNTILTCTPAPAFSANTQIIWTASGENLNGDSLADPTFGFFTTGSGSGGGGSGTNAITTFSVGKVHHYNQTSAGSPALDPTAPYGFSAVTALSSNRTATNITLTLPTASVSNLTQLPAPQAENYVLSAVNTDLPTYDVLFPAGDYSFLVKAASSNQTVVVNLPTTNSMPQPGAPHLTNYPAAQVVDPGQTFVLGWDAFAGGTTTDSIDVDIGTGFGSPNPGAPGALNGTARTFSIPAGTLQPNSNYLSRVGFIHYVGTTNASYATAAFRVTYTEFSLITGAGNQLVLTNANWSPAAFSFNVLCSPGQTFTVEYTAVLSSTNWTPLLTTNSPGTQVHIVSPQAATNAFLFYRARNGP